MVSSIDEILFIAKSKTYVVGGQLILTMCLYGLINQALGYRFRVMHTRQARQDYHNTQKLPKRIHKTNLHIIISDSLFCIFGR
jgi:hypothetical protein